MCTLIWLLLPNCRLTGLPGKEDMEKVFNIQYNIWKKTFKTIQLLLCFVGHPVISLRHSNLMSIIMIWPWNKLKSVSRNRDYKEMCRYNEFHTIVSSDTVRISNISSNFQLFCIQKTTFVYCFSFHQPKLMIDYLWPISWTFYHT